jgi:hypothetical protein
VQVSYKSTRTYEVKLLNRLLDFQSLVDNAVSALVEYSQDKPIDGGIGCNLEIIYPDLELINDLRGGWNHRVERLTGKIHRMAH